MTRLQDELDRDLSTIAERVSPSPDAWEQIQQRIAARAPTQETEIIMLTDNTMPTRRWPLLAAAAAVAAIAIGAIALVNRGDDELPADTPPAPTVPPAPTLPPTTVGSDASATTPLPGQGTPLEPGKYSFDRMGMPIEIDLPALDAGPWVVNINSPLAIAIGTDDGFVGFQRMGSFYGADQAQDPVFVGLGSIPPDDIDGWIEANDVVLVDRDATTIDGRPATFRQVRPPDDAGSELCPAEVQPCIRLNSVSADVIDENPRDGSELSGPFDNAYWFVDMDGYEPLGIWAFAHDGDIESWLEEIAPLLESMTIGDPAPAVEGGTARVPERLTIEATMTVTQTGEPNLAEPWPVERTGTIVGDIDGTIVGTGMSTPNNAEVTMDLVLDVTIEGIGTGTLTVRSHQTWSGDGYIVATDHVLGGTGDFEGVTGFGSTRHTESFPGGEGFRATIELHLALPTN